MIAEAIAFYTENRENYLACLVEHLEICLICMVVCLVLGIPLGYLSAKKEHIATPIITAINALCTIPVIAMFMLLIPVFGLGVVPAVLVISLHSVLTVVVNTMAGIQNVPQSVIESAQGMGFTARQICFRVEFPLAMPLILAGVRTAVVGIIAGATLAAYISAGGLGELVLSGISAMNYGELLLGGGTIVFIVLVFDGCFSLIQKGLSRYGE